jgi:hypothetical protein
MPMARWKKLCKELLGSESSFESIVTEGVEAEELDTLLTVFGSAGGQQTGITRENLETAIDEAGWREGDDVYSHEIDESSLQEMWDLADANQNGEITKEELAAVLAKSQPGVAQKVKVEVKNFLATARAVVNLVTGMKQSCIAGDVEAVGKVMSSSESILGKNHTAIRLAKKGLKLETPALQAKAMADAITCEVEIDQIRALLRRNGFTDDAIVTVLLSSTFLLILILAFIFLGYEALVPPEEIDLMKSATACFGVLGASAGVSKYNSPKDDGGRSIMLIVNYLVDQWKKQQRQSDGDQFVFDSSSEALGTLKRADDFHSAKGAQMGQAGEEEEGFEEESEEEEEAQVM